MLESKCGPGIKEQILQVIFYEIDCIVSSILNQNVTSDCHWINTCLVRQIIKVHVF